MRLIAWNANYNNHRRSLEEAASLLEPLQADILVLSETAQFSQDNPLNAHWFGANGPGLAVIARKGLHLRAHPANAAAPSITAGFEVNGDLRFNLVGAWPVQGASTYHQILMASLDHYVAMFQGVPAIFAGDLNSNTRVIGQRQSHPVFVERAHSHGLVSAYHFQTREPHGKETIGTYCHHCNKSSMFHLDYCFVSQAIAGDARIRILSGDDWSRQSDHFPLVAEIPDGSLHSDSSR